jgi:hypothetical protein
MNENKDCTSVDDNLPEFVKRVNKKLSVIIKKYAKKYGMSEDEVRKIVYG